MYTLRVVVHRSGALRNYPWAVPALSVQPDILCPLRRPSLVRQFSHQGGPPSNIPRWPRRSRASQPVYLGQYKPAALFATLKKLV